VPFLRIELGNPMKIAIAAIGISVAAGLGATASRTIQAAPSEQPRGAVVVVVKATTACFSDLVRVNGYVVPSKTAIVNVDSEGFRVTEVMVAEGDQVKDGQVLARLIRPADAGPPGGAMPPGGAPAGGAGPKVAAAGQGGGGSSGPQSATSATLRAPANGLIIKTTTVGTPASMQSDPLFVIAVDGEFEVEVDVPSIHSGKLKFGETARVAIDDGPERLGRVRQVGVAIDPKTQFGKARISIGKDTSLKLGMFARATIDASRSCGIAIPRSAVDYRTEGTMVQVIKGRTVEMRRVTVGLHSDESIEIRKGINEGDLVVANAGTSLRDGDQVNAYTAEELDQLRVR
jgi:multidrug efflux pump subunit AcrA (membrane-fusion protein)